MNLIFVTDAHYIKTNDGNIYSMESSYSFILFQRYLKYFDEIKVIARVRIGDFSEINPQNLVPNNCVSFVELPYYLGFNEYLRKRNQLKRSIEINLMKIWDENSCVICRVPGRASTIVVSILRKKNIPYALEVISDPYDALKSESVKHQFISVIRVLSYISLRKLTHFAPAVLYVTKDKLQKRYPCSNYSVGASDVIMLQEAYVDKAKKMSSNPAKLICVGTLDQMYKSPDVVISALCLLKEKGLDFVFTWVGDGIYRETMVDLCNSVGLINCVSFVGNLSSGHAVRTYLDKSDIFLIPSRTEGLPRALVEAMARALPCIGTKVGGIPELIDREFLISVNNAYELADRIEFLIKHKDIAEQQSSINLKRSLDYSEEKLGKIRLDFYNHLKSLNQNR